MHYCHIAASCLQTYASVAFYTLHYGSISRGITRGQWGRNYLGAKSLWGAEILLGRRMTAGAPKCPCFRKTSGLKMGASNLILAAGF